MHEVVTTTKRAMDKALEGVSAQLSKIRTGRAHPQLLDHIRVDVYGSSMPLSQVANVHAEGARSLVVSPWDKSQVSACEKALRTSDLGINPARNGDMIRVPLPELTEERRKDLIKVVRDQTETGKVSLRNARRMAMTSIKQLKKDNEITEDEEKRLDAEINKVTELYVEKVAKLCAEKEKELLTV